MTDARNSQRLLQAVPGWDARALDDAELVQLCLEGNASARRQLWDRYSGPVRRLLSRMLSGDVDDQLQETFLRTFARLRTLRDRTALRAFTFGIAANVAQIESRRRAIRKRFLRDTSWDDAVPPDQPVPPNLSEERDALTRLAELLSTLSLETRTPFLLRYVEELEMTEIAMILGVSLSTAKRRVQSAADRVFAMIESDPLLRSSLLPASGHASKGTRTP